MKDLSVRRIRVGRIATLGTLSVALVSVAAPGCSGSVVEPLLLGGGASAGRLANGAAGTTLLVGGTTGSAASGGLGTAGNSASSAGGRAGSPAIVVEPGGAAGAEEVGAAGEAGAPTLGPGDACALSTTTVEAEPAVLELVIDTSGSMDWPPGWAPASPDDSKPAGATKWEITRDALRVAVDSLASDVALGANFFPATTDDDPDTLCLRNEVAPPITLLGPGSSSVRADFQSALDGIVPNGATPTEGAYLFGLEQLAKTKLKGSQFLLLITDGTPTCTLDCECTEDNLAVDSTPLLADASDALAGGVHTFVIGSPGSEDTRNVLSALATNGGTAKAGCSDAGPVYCHLDMTPEPDLASGLASALEHVAESLRSCEYPLPPAPDNRTLDPNLVNVLFTPSGGSTKTVPRDPSKSSCNDGWQYTKDQQGVVLCGALCDEAKSDVGAKVEVLLGCKTVIHEPR